MRRKNHVKKGIAVALAVLCATSLIGCASNSSNNNGGEEARSGKKSQAVSEIILYNSGTIVPDSIEWKESAAGSAMDVVKKLTPEFTYTYRAFTAENAEMTYDEACVERIRQGVDDDIYSLNSDTIINLGREGLLADLSDLDGVDKLLPAIKTACTIDNKLVAFPREYIAYGLIVNNDILKEHDLKIPETDEEFLACCEKLKKDGMKIPMAANRWWLECFVLSQGFADFARADNTEQLVSDLNNGTTKMSTYMRPGFEFLKTCIDKGYIDAKQAASYEAFEERDAYLAGESAFMTSFTGAVTGKGRKLNDYDFDLRIVGFPTKDGQFAVASVTGNSISSKNQNMENAKKAMEAYCSKEATQVFCEKSGNFSARADVELDMEKQSVLEGFMDDVNAGRMVSASNPSINMELWGNTCTVVQHLLAGSSVDECMDEIDKIQAKANEDIGK